MSASKPAVKNIPKKSLASTGASRHVPPDNLDQIAASAAKNEQVASEGILLESRLSWGGRRREAPPYVRDPCGQPDPRVRRNQDHADKPPISRAVAFVS
jgi:hypothetical protein